MHRGRGKALGDVRFQKPYDKLKESGRPAELLRSMSSEDVIAALAAASRENDPYLANVLASEAQNRVGRENAAIAVLSQGVYILDAGSRVVYINQAAADMIQRSEANVLGRPSAEAINLKDGTLTEWASDAPTEIALATGNVIGSENGVLTPIGTNQAIAVAYSVVPMRRGGEVTGIVIVFRDITERRRAERALVESEARLRGVLDAIPDAILVLDPSGRVSYANPGAHELFGRVANELIGVELGIPTVSVGGTEVDVSAAGGTWRLAIQRTFPFEWEHAPALLSIYSQVRDSEAAPPS